MGSWQTNPGCGCARCRHTGLMAPAVLVTVGVLLLLAEWNILSFGRSWPILLIVIGAVRVLWYASGSNGHRQQSPPPGPGVAPPSPPASGEPDNTQKQVEHV